MSELNTIIRRIDDDFTRLVQETIKNPHLTMDDKENITLYVNDDIRFIKLAKSPVTMNGIRYNGYVGVCSKIANECDECELSEDITCEYTLENGKITVLGFDTLHIYNKIPIGMSSLEYTRMRLMTFVQSILKHVDDTIEVNILPYDVENKWSYI